MRHLKFPPYQEGAALVVSLIMLVVMTILAISAVTFTTTGEKMAGNVRNKNISFQSAEAALRTGEIAANNLNPPAGFNAGPTTDGLFTRSEAGDADFPIWTFYPGGTTSWVQIAAASYDPNAAQAPEYMIEDFGTAYIDDDCALIVPLPAGCEVPVYRITAGGYGLNLNGLPSLIQSTYRFR